MLKGIKNLKTKTKLVIGFFVVTAFFLVAVAVAGVELNNINNAYINVVDVNQNIVEDMGQESETIVTMSVDIKGYLLYKDDTYYNDYLKSRDDFNKSITDVANLLELDGQKVDLSQLKQYESDYYVMAQEMVSTSKNKGFDEATKFASEKGRPIIEKLTPEINRITDDQKKVLKHESDDNTAHMKYILYTLIIMSIIAIIVAVSVTISISSFVTSPIAELKSVMQKVADGDLRSKCGYDSKDELGSMSIAFNSMVDSLVQIIARINDCASGLMSSTQQISATTEQIASGSEEQASAAQVINQLASEMAGAIEEVAKSSEHAAEYSQRAVEVAKNGGESVNNSIKGMDEINKKISELEKNSQQIGDIVSVIDDVAEQTNLLALNAAIEAARAGDAGKGFAVVADEVRKLAERSSEATKDIALLIKNIQVNTIDTVKAVNNGEGLTKQLGEAFGNIIKSIEATASRVSEIAAASEEQAAQSTEVVNAVQNIVSVTEETSAGAQETAATSQDIAKMAENLVATVKRFRLE